jgi:hypothetical protein
MDDAVLDEVLGRSHLDQAGGGGAEERGGVEAQAGIPLDRDL